MSPPPDPICELCIAGKLRCPNVPKVAQNHAKAPLELLHMDLHGPLPVSTPEGYQYWHLMLMSTLASGASSYSVTKVRPSLLSSALCTGQRTS
jgi:hypothetical protein